MTYGLCLSTSQFPCIRRAGRVGIRVRNSWQCRECTCVCVRCANEFCFHPSKSDFCKATFHFTQQNDRFHSCPNWIGLTFWSKTNLLHEEPVSELQINNIENHRNFSAAALLSLNFQKSWRLNSERSWQHHQLSHLTLDAREQSLHVWYLSCSLFVCSLLYVQCKASRNFLCFIYFLLFECITHSHQKWMKIVKRRDRYRRRSKV